MSDELPTIVHPAAFSHVAKVADEAWCKADEAEKLLIALAGKDGDNGIIGQLRKADEDKEKRVRKLEDYAIRGRLIGGAMIAVCTALLSWALQRFGG